MKYRILPLVCLSAFLSLQACSNETALERNTSVDTTAVAPGSDAEAAGISGNYASSLHARERKVVRTADMRCRVNDVYAATAGTEKLVTALDGMVTESTLENQVSETRELPYRNDSLRRVRSYTTTAHLTLRVPYQKLDTLLSAIGAGAGFIDARTLKLDDQTLQYLSNSLQNKASERNVAAAKSLQLAKKTTDAVQAGHYGDQRDEARIGRQLSNLEINERSTFATLQIDLYQPERIDAQIVPDTDRLMQAGFGVQAKGALVAGWWFMEQFLVLMLHAWPFLLAFAIGYMAYRRIRSRRKSSFQAMR